MSQNTQNQMPNPQQGAPGYMYSAVPPQQGQQPQAVPQPVPQQGYAYVPTQPAVAYNPYQYPNGYPIYPTNPYYYDPELARKEYEKRLQVEKAKQSLRFLGNMAGLSIILFLLFNTVMSAVLSNESIMNLYRTNPVFSSAFSIVSSFVYLFIPFSIIALLTRTKEKNVNFFPFKKMHKKRALLCLPVGATVFIAANVVTNYIINIAESFGYTLSQQSDVLSEPKTPFALLMALLGTAVMPALLEEYSLRGVILQPARKYGMLFSIISSSVIFGLMHGNLIQAPFAFMVGMCFGYFAIKCDSLWIAVILHFMNNGFSVLMSYLGEKMPEASYNLLYYIIVCAVAVAGVICFVTLVFTDKEFLKKEDGDIAGEEAKLLSAGQKFVAYFVNVPMILSFLAMLLLTAQYVVKK